MGERWSYLVVEGERKSYLVLEGERRGYLVLEGERRSYLVLEGERRSYLVLEGERRGYFVSKAGPAVTWWLIFLEARTLMMLLSPAQALLSPAQAPAVRMRMLVCPLRVSWAAWMTR